MVCLVRYIALMFVACVLRAPLTGTVSPPKQQWFAETSADPVHKKQPSTPTVQPLRMKVKMQGVSEICDPRWYYRDVEITELFACLDRRGSGIVAIVGHGGVGKTVLATFLAREHSVSVRFPDGIFWLTCGRVYFWL